MVGMLVAIDQLTKFLVSGNFHPGQNLTMIENYFNLTLVYNYGAAFGLLSNMSQKVREPFFFLIPSLTLLLILYVFSRLQETQQMSIYALSMIVGGALGNLIDRLRLGFVVDFVDFHWNNKYHFPAFNIADGAISIGVFILLLSILYEKETEKLDASHSF
jgi:signal peptidase II